MSPIPNDHPALPNTLTVTFEGDAIVRARAVPTRGSVQLTRTGWDQVEATLVDPPRTPPGPMARASLFAALPGEAQAALRGLDLTRPGPEPDALLGDPARCLARVAEFDASPIPEAKEALRLGLETAPQSPATGPCSRAC
ncbi:MAG: hypothetical protein IPO67_13800 [Deltaproteobacteria bacterium]|nr:hypothetical protein [Deltaproteobacteria bacterium]